MHSLQVKKYEEVVVGFTEEQIDGTQTSCRNKECELGRYSVIPKEGVRQVPTVY